MKLAAKKLHLFGVVLSIAALACSTQASAHVVVRPSEAVSAGFQTFTVGVPNEKDVPTTEVKLLLPDTLEHVTPTQKSGWIIDIEEGNSNQNEKTAVQSITWRGGEVGVGLREEFTFSAKVPASTGELQWKAYQTYADGSVVAWDKNPEEGDGHDDSDTGPYSITSVVDETSDASAIKKADEAAADAKAAASRASYLAIAGLAVGLIAIFFATRSK